MICSTCNTENSENASFCTTCGELLASDVYKSEQLPHVEPATIIQQLSDTPAPTLSSAEHSSFQEPAQQLLDIPTPTLSSAEHDPSQQPTQELPDIPAPALSSAEREPSQEPTTIPSQELNLATGTETMASPHPAVTSRIKKLETRFGGLARPVPLWAIIPMVIIVVGGIVVLQLTGSDWANGALHTAIASASIAGLILLATGVRALVGMRQIPRFIGPGIAVLILLLLSLTGFTQQKTIHGLQAHNLEDQKQWERAITEYKLAGEVSPSSDNIARTYVEWGEQLNAQQQYAMAITQFDIVREQYPSATKEVVRAQSDEIAAYVAWGKQQIQQQDYTTAIALFDALLKESYCDQNCQSQVRPLDATAYYKLAESQLASQQYDSAVQNFQAVLQQFPDSGEARQVHADLAAAMLGSGKQQLANDCSSAIPTYQQLSKEFADTPAGQEATRALQAAQPVTGRFVGTIPNDPSLALVVFLVKNIHGTDTPDQIVQTMQGAPTETIHSDGSFSFKPV